MNDESEGEKVYNEQTKNLFAQILKMRIYRDKVWKRFYLFRPQKCEHILIVMFTLFLRLAFTFCFKRFVYRLWSDVHLATVGWYLTIQLASVACSQIISRCWQPTYFDKIMSPI